MQVLLTNYLKDDSHSGLVVFDNYESLEYKNSILLSIYRNKQVGVYTTKDITKGTLLCIENGLIGSPKELEIILEKKRNLSNHLCPRGRKHNLKEKITHNSFDWFEKGDIEEWKDKNLLCPFISTINHNCIPNTGVTRFLKTLDEVDEELGEEIPEINGGLALYAVEDITKGSEITLSYDWTAGHGHSTFNWNCNCPHSLEERRKSFNTNSKYISTL